MSADANTNNSQAQPQQQQEVELKDASQKYLQLFISCKGLSSLDFFSKSDPMAVLFVQKAHKNEDGEKEEVNKPCFGLFAKNDSEDTGATSTGDKKSPKSPKSAAKQAAQIPDKEDDNNSGDEASAGMFYEIGRTNMIK